MDQSHLWQTKNKSNGKHEKILTTKPGYPVGLRGAGAAAYRDRGGDERGGREPAPAALGDAQGQHAHGRGDRPGWALPHTGARA